MHETVLFTDIAFALDVPRLAQIVHLPADRSESRQDWDDLEALAARAQATGRPKAVYRPGLVTARRADAVEVDRRIELKSQTLSMMLGDQERLWFYCATCGTEILALAGQLDILQQYWLEEIKMLMLRAALDHLARAIRQASGVSRLSSMGPGSGDAGVWDISELAKVFQALGRGFAAEAGVTLTDSMLMLPNKSAAGVHFPLAKKFASCQLCHRENCPNRRARFDHELWDATMVGHRPDASHPGCAQP